MNVENYMLRLLCQTISMRSVPAWFIDFSSPLNQFKVQSAGTGVKPLWRNNGTHSVDQCRNKCTLLTEAKYVFTFAVLNSVWYCSFICQGTLHDKETAKWPFRSSNHLPSVTTCRTTQR